MSDTRFRWGDPVRRQQRPARRPERELLVLVAVAVVSVVVWQLPHGNLVLYPFTILATWFHEMGHGVTAVAVGGGFERLDIFSDGSGLAHHTLPADAAGFRQALVAAGGPLGPAMAGALLIGLSPRVRVARGVLGLLGVVMLASVAIWIRTAFGMGAISLFGVSLLAVAARGNDRVAHFTVNLLGVQACISTYRQVDYLFTHSVNINGRQMLSDTGRIGELLFLPYQAWAILIIIVSVGLLAWSLRTAYRPRRS